MNPQISKLVKVTRQALGSIFAVRKLPKSEAEAAGLSCQPKADPVAINKLFDGVKPYEPMPK